jgi:ubiquinol-cytochrome c reductase cytochrome c1 subunit
VRYFILIAILLGSPLAYASGGGHALDKVNIDLKDTASLRHGAELFVDYCLSCHSAAFMRYNRIGADLGMTDEEVAARLMTAGDKVGDTMKVAMDPAEAKRWFGTAPPDLSVIARARGTDWLYTYLRSFYRDDSRPWGVNNRVFKDVAMPHVLWELQGLQAPVIEKHVDEDGKETDVVTGFKLVEKGKLSPEEYNVAVRDLVNFLAYLSEPSKIQRVALGKWVLIFLAAFFVVVFLLKKEYWKDVH